MNRKPEYHNIYELPANLPVPVDDGACTHLKGHDIPSVSLQSTSGKFVNIEEVSRKKVVLFFFPAAGRPGVPAPKGWNEIPGARGCTPQICSFREATEDIRKLKVELYGISAQRHEDQVEIAKRNRIPYELLSDVNLKFATALALPTFEIEPSAQLFPKRCIKRLTLVVELGTIRKVFYPVFPPDHGAAEVLAHLRMKRNPFS